MTSSQPCQVRIARLVLGPLFPGLARALLDALRAAAENGAGPTLVVLGTEEVLAQWQERLAAAGLSQAARLATLRRLVWELARERKEASGRALLPPHAADLLAQAVAGDLPEGHYYARVAARANFPAALRQTIFELRQAGVAPDELERASDALPPSARARVGALAECYRALWARLSRRYCDSEDLHTWATEGAADLAARFEVQRVAVWGLGELHSRQRRLLEACAAVLPLEVYLPCEPARPEGVASAGGGEDAAGATRPAAAYEAVGTTSAWLRSLARETVVIPPEQGESDLARVRRWWFAAPVSAPGPAGDGSLRIVSAPGEVREAAEVARALLGWARQGIRFGEMAVLFPGGRYLPLLCEALERAGIPFYTPDGPALATTPSGRAVELLLDLPERDWSRDAVLEWLAVSPVGEGVFGPDFDVARWEGVSIRAGVVRGLDQWRDRLDRFAARQARRAAAPDEDEEAAGAAACDALDAHALRAAVERLAGEVEAVRQARSWSRFVSRLDQTLVDLLADTVELTRVREAIDTLSGLDEADPTPTWPRLRAMLGRALAAAGPAEGEFGGDRVALLPLDRAHGLHFRAVALMGLAEGVLPAPRQDPLLGDEERRALNQAWGEERLALAARGEASARLHVGLALGAAGERLLLTYPRVDALGGRPRVPSFFLLEALDALCGRGTDPERLRTLPIAHHVAVSALAPEDPAEAIDLREYDLSVVAGRLKHSAEEALAYLRAVDPTMEQRAAAARAARDPALTPYDGLLGPRARRRLPAGGIAGQVLPPTTLEQYATCPQQYFLSRVLGVVAQDPPEQILRIDRRRRGTLVHQVLQAFYAKALAEGLVPLRRADRDRHRARLLTLLDEHGARVEAAGEAGFPLLWRIDHARLAEDLLRWLDAEIEEAERSGFVPVEVELEFDDVPLTLGGEVGVRLRGRIDRVDRDAEGRLRITDYKTGRRPPGQNDDELHGGRALQLPLYLHAVAVRRGLPLEQVEARYHYVSREGGLKQVVWHGASLACRQADLERALSTIASGVAEGRFFPLPERPDICQHCDFRLVCSRDVLERSLRKCADPAATPLLTLRQTVA